MKITMEFNLPEDGDKYRNVVNSGAAWDALRELHYRLRNHIKHEAPLQVHDLLGLVSETLSTGDQGLEL